MRLCSENLCINHLPGAPWNQAVEGRTERLTVTSHNIQEGYLEKKHIWKTSLLQIQGSRDPSLKNTLHDRSGCVAQSTRVPFYVPTKISQNTNVWATDKALCKWSWRFMDQFSSQYSASRGTSHWQLPLSYHASEKCQQHLKPLPVLQGKKSSGFNISRWVIYIRDLSVQKIPLNF